MKPWVHNIAWAGILIFLVSLAGCGFIAFNNDPERFEPKKIVKTELERVAGTTIIRLVAESESSFARDLGEIFFGIPPELSFIEFVVQNASRQDFDKLYHILDTYGSEYYKDSYRLTFFEDDYGITAYFNNKENRDPRRSITSIEFEKNSSWIKGLLICPATCTRKVVTKIFDNKEGVPLSPITQQYYRILEKRLSN